MPIIILNHIAADSWSQGRSQDQTIAAPRFSTGKAMVLIFMAPFRLSNNKMLIWGPVNPWARNAFSRAFASI